MKFDVPKIHKWAENIEYTLTDWAEEHVQDWFEVEDTNDLTSEQIEKIEEFLAEADDMWYDWVCMGFRNIVHNWENEHYDD
jgi:hypothetical protein